MILKQKQTDLNKRSQRSEIDLIVYENFKYNRGGIKINMREMNHSVYDIETLDSHMEIKYS